MIIDILLAVFGLTAVGLSQGPDRYQKWAPVLGLLGQPFWFISTYLTGNWGIFILCPVYTFLWGMGFWRQWIKPSLWWGEWRCTRKGKHVWVRCGEWGRRECCSECGIEKGA